jgi:hypothetical protein
MASLTLYFTDWYGNQRGYVAVESEDYSNSSDHIMAACESLRLVCQSLNYGGTIEHFAEGDIAFITPDKFNLTYV